MDPSESDSILNLLVPSGVLVSFFIALVYCVTTNRNGHKRVPDHGSEYARIPVAVKMNVAQRKRAMPSARLYARETRTAEVRAAIREMISDLPSSLILDKERLKLENPIGSGNFGVVFKGSLSKKNSSGSIEVAVKTTLAGTKISDITDFLKEALRMRNFNHENVLSMMGFIDSDGKPYVLLPYMANGDLRTYLQNGSRRFTLLDLMLLAQQVCNGMTYLSRMKFIHRDLACRNCMVSQDQVVKVGDFGLSCDLHNDDYYRMKSFDKPLPVRWMAIECFVERKHSLKSDVWSFGVLLWEITTRGKMPYEGKGSEQVIALVKRGALLERPSHLPELVYDIMRRCWQRHPKARPNFKDLYGQIGRLIGQNV